MFTFQWTGTPAKGCVDADGDGLQRYDASACPNGADCDDYDPDAGAGDCGAQSVCYRGACYPSCEATVDCEDPASQCYDGRCAADRCDGVDCADGQLCYRGACYPS